MYWQIAFLTFLTGTVVAISWVWYRRRQHPEYEPGARIKWLNPFDFEWASLLLLVLGIAVLFLKFVYPPLGSFAAFLMGMQAGLTVMKQRSYDSDTGGNTHYIE